MRPILKYSVVCDDVGSTGDGKPIFYGVFDAIRAEAFPATHPYLYVVNCWTAGRGKFRERLRVLSPDGLETLANGSDTPFKLENRSCNHVVRVRLERLQFPRPGVYWVQVLLDDEVLVEYPLRAEKMPVDGSDADA